MVLWTNTNFDRWWLWVCSNLSVVFLRLFSWLRLWWILGIVEVLLWILYRNLFFWILKNCWFLLLFLFWTVHNLRLFCSPVQFYGVIWNWFNLIHFWSRNRWWGCTLIQRLAFDCSDFRSFTRIMEELLRIKVSLWVSKVGCWGVVWVLLLTFLLYFCVFLQLQGRSLWVKVDSCWRNFFVFFVLFFQLV